MKKLAILAILAVAAVAASATEITVSGVRNSTQDNVTGYNVLVTQPVATGLLVGAKFENTKGVDGTNVDQYGVGAMYDVAKVGTVTLSGIGALGYAEAQASAAKGTYVQFGGQASAVVPYVKDLSASVAVIRQLGTSAVTGMDHTEATVGLGYSVTKAIAVKASATVYDATPGNKYQLGASYSF